MSGNDAIGAKTVKLKALKTETKSWGVEPEVELDQL